MKAVTIRKKLDAVQKAKAKAQAEIEKIDVAIEAENDVIGKSLIDGKEVDTSKLDELNAERKRQILLMRSLDKQDIQLKVDLNNAIDDEYSAKAQELRDEGRRQLIEIAKTIDTLYKQVAVYRGYERNANRQLVNEYGRGGLSSFGLPVDSIIQKTDYWLGRDDRYNVSLTNLVKDAGILTHKERHELAQKEYQLHAEM